MKKTKKTVSKENGSKKQRGEKARKNHPGGNEGGLIECQEEMEMDTSKTKQGRIMNTAC
jgi:hypothetical protein